MKAFFWRLTGLTALLLAIVSCSKVIDVSIPDSDRKLVINGLISEGQPFRLSVSRSLSVLERDTLLPLEGGHVVLYRGDSQIGVLSEDSAGFYSLPGFLPASGTTYRLTAGGDNLNPIEAFATIPQPVPILRSDTSRMTYEWGQQELRLSVTFRDPAGVRNQYGFSADVTYKEYDYLRNAYTGRKLTHTIYLSGSSNDQFLQDESHEYAGRIYFDDLLFDGMEKRIEFGINDYAYYESDTVWLTARLMQVDESFFTYVLSLEAYQNARGNPFAEPVQVFSNIEGGYGIFAGTAADSVVYVTPGSRRY